MIREKLTLILKFFYHNLNIEKKKITGGSHASRTASARFGVLSIYQSITFYLGCRCLTLQNYNGNHTCKSLLS